MGFFAIRTASVQPLMISSWNLRVVVTSARLGRRVEGERAVVEVTPQAHGALGHEAAGDDLVEAVHVGVDAGAEHEVDDALHVGVDRLAGAVDAREIGRGRPGQVVAVATFFLSKAVALKSGKYAKRCPKPLKARSFTWLRALS